MNSVDKNYVMQIGKPARYAKPEARPRRVPKGKSKPSPQEMFRAFKSGRGYEAIVAQIPKAASIAGWFSEIAHFSVCKKTGSALWLDLWDCDHFDGVTDMQRCVSDCRAWFSHTGFTTWGSSETATGRINCHFDATVAGAYTCVAKLTSDPSSSGAVVECLIDSHSFGNLSFTGTIVQSHFSMLAAGRHSFRIRQVRGAFFFQSLTVNRF
jgi:hypothetical protein